MTLQEAEKLISKPRRWARLTAAELEELIRTASWLSATRDDAGINAAVGRLYLHVVETLPPEVRRQIASDLGGMLEDYARTHGRCPVRALGHSLLTDQDPGVVSTAALACAQVMKASEEDPLRGPRTVLQIATDATDWNRQVAIVTGLAAMGDSRVLDLIAGAWERLAGDARSEILRNMGSQPPTVAAIEFLISRLERAAQSGTAWPTGVVATSLLRMSDAARGVDAGTPFAGSWVRDVVRAFPSWRVPADADVVTIRAIYSVGEVGRWIGPRLSRLAARESYPRLLPFALRAYGVEDTPFVDAVRQAVAESAVPPRQSASLDEPLPIEPHADWERHDAVLEWGILNPYGPTKVQLCLVTVDEETRALVYALHNPFGPVCLLLGVMPAAASVGKMLLALADRFRVGDHVLLKGLPHWVGIPQEPDVLSPAGAAAFFMKLHRRALAEDLAIDGDIEELICQLGALRRDPQGEVRRQFAQAAALASAALAEEEGQGADAAVAGVRESLAQYAPATLEDYERWLSAASAPGHAADVSSHFLYCWNAATRFKRREGGSE